MLTKEELDAQLQQTKALEARTTAAEAKATAAQAKLKALEDEKAAAIASGKGWAPVSRSGMSDEQKAMRMFGVSHVKSLLTVNTAHPRYRRVPDEYKHMVVELKKNMDTARFIAQLFHGQPLDRIGQTEEKDFIAHVKGIFDTPFGREIALQVKAFGSTVSGSGDEWVPTAMAASYIEEYEQERVLASRVRTIPMPTNPFELTVMKNVTKARKATENTSATAATFGTDKLTFSATKLVEYYEIPEELNEDSAPDFLAAGRDEVVKAQDRAEEAAMLNGDDDGTHIDSDTQAGAADLCEKIWKGWRRQAIANSANGATVDASNALFSEAVGRTMRARMGKFGSNPGELLWIVGASVYTQLLALPSVITVDKFGPQATVLRGALAAYQGIPIVNAEYMREDLNATGVYDGLVTDRAGVLLVNTTRWYLGQRRPIRVKLMQDLPKDDRWLLASYQRKDFKGHTQGAVEKSVIYGYNLAK
jgi:HK97 family phage major capsid protein